MDKKKIKQKIELLAFLITAEARRADDETDYEFLEFCSDQLDKYMRMYDPTIDEQLKRFDSKMAKLLNHPEQQDFSS